MELPENILNLSLKGFDKAIIWHSEGIYFGNIDEHNTDVKSWIDTLKDELHGHEAIIERIRIFSDEDEIHIWRNTEGILAFRQWSINSMQTVVLKDEHQLMAGTKFDSSLETDHFQLIENRGVKFKIPTNWIGNSTDYDNLNKTGSRLYLSMQSAYRFDKNIGYTLYDYRYVNISLHKQKKS